MRSFASTLFVFTFAPLFASGVVGRPIMMQDTTKEKNLTAQIVATKTESSYPILFAREIDFTGPEADSTPGVIDNTSNADHLTSIILDAAVSTEATASLGITKQTSISASTIPIVVLLSEPYELQLSSSTITSISNEPTSTPTPSSSSNIVEMPVYVVPVQAAPQMLEQIVSISISSDISTSSNIPDATSLPNLKATTHTLAAPWNTSSSSPDNILFNTNIQILIIALSLIALTIVAGLFYTIRFYWRRYRRTRTDVATTATITDDQIIDQEAGLDIKESPEVFTDYKRGTAPVGLEWQIREMREKAKASKSPKARPRSFKPRDRVVSAPEYYTPRKSQRAQFAAFVKSQEDDDSSSIFDYYFNTSPTGDDAEVENTSRKSLDSSMEEEKQASTPLFERGDLAGQAINGFRLYLPLKPSPLRYGFVPL